MKSACIFAACALLAIACTTKTTTTTTPPDTSTEQKPTDPVADKGSSSKTDAGSTSTGGSSGSSGSSGDAPSAPECSDTTDQQSCVQCCADGHQKGAQVYMGALLKCLCEASACATECKTTICAASPKNPDSTCETCMNSKSQDCGSAIETACTASTECLDFNQCATDADCGTKK